MSSIAIIVKNSNSVDVYMLDTKVTVNQLISKYINQNKDYDVLFLIQCLKRIVFIGFFKIKNNSTTL